MLVVVSGVWIDSFNGAPSPARATLRRLLAAGHTLLHADRDFDAFEATLGLRAWRH
jgi:hypothetical protein